MLCLCLKSLMRSSVSSGCISGAVAVDEQTRTDKFIVLPLFPWNRGTRPGRENTRCTCGTPERARRRPAGCARCHRPRRRVGGASFRSIVFFARKFHETSVTRSLCRKRMHWLHDDRHIQVDGTSRVMHMSRGMPLISAEHDRHLPPCSSISWQVGSLLRLDAVHPSRTTMPSSTGVGNPGMRRPRCLPPDANVADVAISFVPLLHLFNHCLQLIRHRRKCALLDLHLTVCAATDDDVVSPHSASLPGKSSRNCAPRLSFRSSAARVMLQTRSSCSDIDRRVPAVVVLAIACDACSLCPGS